MTDRYCRILLVEDNLGDAEILQELLEESSVSEFDFRHVVRVADALTHLSEENFDVILLDLSLPDSNGLETLMRIRESTSDLPIVVMTGFDDEKLALSAVREGAQDYLVKGQVHISTLARSICYAIERKKAEIAMRAALEKERELREVKSKFVSMVSHELRSPLTTILASADLLEKFNKRLSDEKKLEMQRQIKAAAKRMSQTIDDLQALWLSDSNKVSFVPVLLDVKIFLRKLLEEFQIQLENRSNSLTNCDIDLVLITRCDRCDACMDRNLLRQIASNLISNAIKYSPQGGQIKVELESDGINAVFRISDRGIGIPEADRTHLFQTFYRASNTGGISGTGLGLAIVKKAVELHGGAIAFESEVGVGSTFTVTLPLRPELTAHQAIACNETV